MCSLASLLSSNRQRSEHGRSRAPGADAISQRSRFEPSATLGYGIPVFGGRFTGTPKIGLGLSDTDRELKLGWRLGLARREGNVSMDLELEATRRESANDDREPEQAVGLRFTMRW